MLRSFNGYWRNRANYLLDKEEQKFKTSIEKAIWRSSPFVLPSNPEVRKQARKFNIKFHVK